MDMEFHENRKLTENLPVTQRVLDEKTLVYDIETTGLGSRFSQIYCIGFAYRRDDHIFLTQIFAPDQESEKAILCRFLDETRSFERLLSFNGENFDIRFLKEKCEAYGLDSSRLNLPQIDLYRILRPYRSMLGLSDMKQKTLEMRLGTGREDPYNGGELIQVYRKYRKNHDDMLLRDLLRHNADDLAGLCELTSYLSFPSFFEGGFTPVETYRDQDPNLTFSLKTDYALPFSLNYYSDGIYLHADGCRAHLQVPVFVGQLKYFYQDFRNYYYFPAEDQAYHKDAARFADPSHRQKATAKTAYTKRNGSFIPNPSGMKEKDSALPLFYPDAAKETAYLLLPEQEEDKKRFPVHDYVQGILFDLLKSTK